ncbi:MFS transporter [Haloferula sp. BvORR071]|uniref:MFS transporter n=1 Tax=Haloferula sp. BvORR071 TaxID=1396141 RepID=UPI000697AB13|nr:MFS transporter [Haloferula sp. BvORR071]
MADLSDKSSSSGSGWWSQLAPYQRLVFVVATLAWLFDCLDQQLFNLARNPAMVALLNKGQDAKYYGGIATAIFVLGWATGGMIFGSLGDRYGRAKMLAVTVLLYSLATGLSALAGFPDLPTISQSLHLTSIPAFKDLSAHYVDFTIFRFITGLGVGGVFGLAVALVADTVPSQVRPRALGVLQSFSAVGNCAAGLIGLAIALTAIGSKPNYWMWLFLIGALPAFMVATIQLRMKEPQAWIEARDRAAAQGKKAGSYKDLFAHSTWRRHALFGMVLSCAGVIGLWGIGVFSTDLVGDIIAQGLNAQKASPEAINKGKQLWGSLNLLCFNGGAFIGMLAFTKITEQLGRKKAFAISFIGSLIVTVFVFQMIGKINGQWDILWMAPLMGFFHLSVFAGFSIYLPELFPTRLRATGVSFCYNVGRYAAASGPLTLAYLAKNLADKAAVKAAAEGGNVAIAKIDAFRDAASWMCLIFLLGLIVLPFLPETKGQPLPED